MPIYEIEAHGKKFEVEAPNQQAALSGISKMKPAQQPQQSQKQNAGGSYQVASSMGMGMPAPQTQGGNMAQDFEGRLAQIRASKGDAFTDNMLALRGKGPIDLEDAPAAKRLRRLDRTLMGLNAVNRFTSAATLGVPDRIQGAMMDGYDAVTGGEGGNFEKLKDMNADLKEQFPKSSMAADISGTVVGVGKLSGAKYAPSAAAKGKGLLATTGALGVEGAAIGGTQALMEGGDVLGTAKRDGLATAGLNVATRGVGKTLAPLADPLRRAALPTAQAIKRSASNAYDSLAKSNVAIPAQAMSGTVDNVLARLNAPDVGLDKAIHPATTRITKALEDLRGGAKMSELQNILKRTKRVGGQHGEDAFAANLAQKEIRKTLAKLAPEADGMLTKADTLHNRGSNAGRIDNAIEKAITQARGSGSGGNTNNAVRSAMGRLADGKKSKYFDADTKAALQKVKAGSRANNTARMFGQAFDPTGGGLRGMLNTAGMFASGGASIPLAVGGAVARRAGERGTIQAARDISRRIRAQGMDIPESKIHQMLQDPQQAQMLARILGAQASPMAAAQTGPQPAQMSAR